MRIDSFLCVQFGVRERGHRNHPGERTHGIASFGWDISVCTIPGCIEIGSNLFCRSRRSSMCFRSEMTTKIRPLGGKIEFRGYISSPRSALKCSTSPPPERGRGPSGGGGPVLRDFPARGPASTRNAAAVPSDRSVTGPPGGGRAPRREVARPSGRCVSRSRPTPKPREVARPSGRGRGWPDRNRAGAPAEFPLPRQPPGTGVFREAAPGRKPRPVSEFES